MYEIRVDKKGVVSNRILIKGTWDQVRSQIEFLKHKYGADTPIGTFISDPGLWVEP